jgi:hypothetical protein
MSDEPRQRIERAPGRARRARLTPAPGSDPSPDAPAQGADEDAGAATPAPKRGVAASDDERITREKPPHW